MKTVNIRLSSINDIRKFVDITNQFPYETELTSGNYTVNGNSIMGIFGLDLQNPIKLTINNDNCDDILEKLKDFIA